MKKALGILLATAMLMTSFALPVLAASSSGGGGGGGVISTLGVQGIWTYHKEIDKWTFADTTGYQYKGRWGYLYNPYTKRSVKVGWYYFDEQGYMLTGWNWIKSADGKARCYYMYPVPDGDRGTVQLGGTVTDENGTREVNADGAWIQNGKEVTR